MSCEGSLKQRCKKVYAKCVAYESEVPDFSGLIEDECINIEEVADDLYELVGEIKEEIDLTELENSCLTLPVDLTVKNVIQLLIDTICTQQETIETMQTTITTMQASIEDLQANICE